MWLTRPHHWKKAHIWPKLVAERTRSSLAAIASSHCKAHSKYLFYDCLFCLLSRPAFYINILHDFICFWFPRHKNIHNPCESMSQVISKPEHAKRETHTHTQHTTHTHTHTTHNTHTTHTCIFLHVSESNKTTHAFIFVHKKIWLYRLCWGSRLLLGAGLSRTMLHAYTYNIKI